MRRCARGPRGRARSSKGSKPPIPPSRARERLPTRLHPASIRRARGRSADTGRSSTICTRVVAGACDVRLSTIVRRISWRRGAVAVETITPQGEVRTIRARAAIVTLPIGVLRHEGDETAIAFDPALPAAKLEAIEHLEMGHVVKVSLWFRTAFWETLRDGRYRDGSFFPRRRRYVRRVLDAVSGSRRTDVRVGRRSESGCAERLLHAGADRPRARRDRFALRRARARA